MKLYFIAVAALLASVMLACSSESDCGEGRQILLDEEEEELSLLETILLFPFSIIGKIQLPSEIGGASCNTGQDEGISSTALQRWRRMVSSVTESVDRHVTSSLVLTWERGPAHLVPDWTLSVSAAATNCIAEAETKLLTCLAEIKNVLYNIDSQQVLPALQTGLFFIRDQVTSLIYDGWNEPQWWPDAWGDFVRYILVILLALSMIPLLMWKDDIKSTMTKANARRSVRSKRSLETKVESDPSYLTWFYRHTLSPVLERSREHSVSPHRRQPNSNNTLTSVKADPQGHYLMCESFDNLHCNCGGKQLSLPNRNCQVKSLKCDAQGHFLMCEYFDNLHCNCGGKQPSLPNRKCQVKSLKGDAQGHYLMCEYFDSQKCNCGGKLLSPIRLDHASRNVYNRSMALQSIALNRIETNDTHQMNKSNKQSNLEVPYIREVDIKTGSSILKLRRRKQLRKELNSSSPLHDPVVSDDVFSGTSGDDIQSPQQRATLELYEAENGDANLDLSFGGYIGEPCCNSSFKEECVYIINDAVEPGVIGDGPEAHGPTIITRRSPRKQSGIQFEETDYLPEPNGSFEDSRYEDDDDIDESLLDLNKSFSYSEGKQGLFEITVLFVMQRLYRWTRKYLRERNLLQQGNLSEVSLNLSTSLNKLKSYVGRLKNEEDSLFNVSMNAKENSLSNVSMHAKESSVDLCYNHTGSSAFKFAGEGFTDKYQYEFNRGDGPCVKDRDTSVDLVHERQDSGSLANGKDTALDLRADGSYVDSKETSVDMTDEVCQLLENDRSTKHVLLCDNTCFRDVADVVQELTEGPGMNTEPSGINGECREVILANLNEMGYLPDDEDMSATTQNRSGESEQKQTIHEDDS